MITEAVADRIMARIVNPVIEAMAADGRPYKGVLYAGLMIVDGQPRVLEFNVRFGDPECQPLMMRLKSDLVEALEACADGTLETVELAWHDEATLVVVLATRGYPGWYENGSEIRNLDKAAAIEGVAVFHAGTKLEDGHLLANGGRVLGVTARGATVADAQARAYRAVALVDWPEGFCRRDIGWRAVGR